MIRVTPIRFVADIEAARRFYAVLGLEFALASRPGNWAELTSDTGALGLHTAATAVDRTPGDVELSFTTDEDLETLAERLTAAGYPPEGIVDENFGRSLRVCDPDGVIVQIHDHDPELYT